MDAIPNTHKTVAIPGSRQPLTVTDVPTIKIQSGEVLVQQTGSSPGDLHLDCIGPFNGTVEPITRVADSGSRVAILLSVLVRDAMDVEAPIYEGDANGLRTPFYGISGHTYAHNLKDHLQPMMIPALLENGIVQPLKQRVVEGDTLLDRPTNALNLMRIWAPSGERLVWKVSA